MQPSIDLQKLAIIIIQRYEQIRAISYTFSYNILNKSPTERIKLTGTQVIN